MTEVYDLDQIKSVVDSIDLEGAIEKGFVAYSRGNAVVPPVGELVFDDPPGDTHIKYGYIRDRETYVVKIASGFYKNPAMGLDSSSGLMMVFSQKTGHLQAVLLDNGYLTNVRTAVAGRICAKYLAPENVSCIGVLGTGIQARMQVEYLKGCVDCTDIRVWGPTLENARKYRDDMEALGYRVRIADSPGDVARHANLIVTTTPSTTPLLKAGDISPGTHITAMGSDTPGKQELDPQIIKSADLIVADSRSQCRERGEIARAYPDGEREGQPIPEIGELIENPGRFKRRPSDITAADLTGVAVQDIQIASAVCRALEKKEVNHD